MTDILNFCDTKIVDILSVTVDSKLVVNLKTPDRLKRSNKNNPNITETPTSFDNKITESISIEHNKFFSSIQPVDSNPKKSDRNCLRITVFVIFLSLLQLD